MDKNIAMLDHNTHEFTLVCLNDIFKQLTKQKRKLNRIKFMNRLYFVAYTAMLLGIYDELTKEIKELKKTIKENVQSDN